MASYGKFQSDNAKYGEKNRDNYNPEFNPTVKPKTDAKESIFEKNLPKWVDFISWCRWESDGLLDLLKPPKGGITLHFDQRVFIRSIMRFFSVYGVFPRGFSKTYLEILCLILVAMLYPNIELALTAQTKENGAKFLSDKYTEITRHYPILKNEVIKTNFSKDGAEILFANNSTITNLPNSQTAKGQRRKRINIEESALLNGEVFDDALAPVVEVPRNTIGKLAIVNPEELNQQINFFTTSGFRNSDEWFRSLKMVDNMVNLEGEIVLGSNWMLACWYGRGSSKEQILKKKKKMSSVSFAQNYNSSWVSFSPYVQRCS
ncbi:MAG: hypothetical protein WCO84_01595 [bacterium]